jgi:uncharacterized oligopeptide transporter (OPT) family protein
VIGEHGALVRRTTIRYGSGVDTAAAPTTAAAIAETPALAPVPGVTVRSVVAGLLLAVVLCAMNSYLTLSFGVIEEGPTIAALIFFTFFFLSRSKITTTEMVIVSTMGSAGGSFGFIANFYAAKAMTGTPYSIPQMIGFGIISSMVGMLAVVPLRELLVRREKLPWPGAKATESVIRSLVEEGDKRQPIYLLITFLLCAFYVVFNNEDGVGWFPAEVALGGLATIGGALSISPFNTFGSYLMGMRTCVGFLVGAGVLMGMSHFGGKQLLGDNVASPHRYYWPGIGFLTASGLTLIAVNWRVTVASFSSLFSLGRGTGPDPEQILPSRWYVAAIAATVIGALFVLFFLFDVPILIVVVLIAIGGLVQNIIATRAQAQTAFNPARVMGILLQGVCALLGGRGAATNLTGAGFVAGSGAQAGNLTGDMAYGKAFRTPPRWQWIAQGLTILPCAIVAAYVFSWLAGQKPMTFDSQLAAPVAKTWGAAAQIFEGGKGQHSMPPGALTALLIGGAAGVIYTLLEVPKRVRDWIPCSVGLGLGLVLPVSYGLSFFIGGFMMWIVLGRWLKVRDVSLTTIAVGSIVAEGIGGVLKALLAAAGVL